MTAKKLLPLCRRPSAWMGVPATIIFLACVEFGRNIGILIPTPFLGLLVLVTLTAAFGGTCCGLVAAGLGTGYTIYAAAVGFGPLSLTGGPIQIFMGAAMYFGIAWTIGYNKDRNRQLIVALHEAKSSLDKTVANRTNQLLQANKLLRIEIKRHRRSRKMLEVNNMRLHELDRLRIKLIKDLTHEIRTPLTNIVLHSELITKGKPEKRLAYLSVMKGQVERVNMLLAQVENYARLPQTLPSNSFTDVKVQEIVQDAIVPWHQHVQEKGLNLNVVIDDVSIVGHRSLLTNSLDNIIANAIQYSDSGDIRVVAYCASDQLCIQVEDEGPGIPEDEIDQIFDHFYRGSQISQLDKPGIGIGLTYARDVVQLHGGHIDVISEIGEGTCFSIYLPRSEAIHYASA